MNKIISTLVYAIGWLILPSFADAQNTDTQRQSFQTAYHQIERNGHGNWQRLAQPLQDYVLYPYLHYAALKNHIERADHDEIVQFLNTNTDSPIANDIRARYLRHLGEQKSWQKFTSVYQGSSDLQLRCFSARAAIAQKADAAAIDNAKALYVTGSSLPTACDELIAWLSKNGHNGDALKWQRVENAFAAKQSKLIAFLAKSLPAQKALDANRFVQAIDNPDAALNAAKQWPDHAPTRAAATSAFSILTRRNTDAAIRHWAALEKKFAWSQSQRGAILAVIALYRAAEFHPDAKAWLARVPEDAFDKNLHEWRFRVALASNDFLTIASAYSTMPVELQEDPRFRYIHARALEKLGRKELSLHTLQALAREANYHGFLAADRLQQPYAICPISYSDQAKSDAEIAMHAGISRALELHAIGWLSQARREWDFAVKTLSSASKVAAVKLAVKQRWYERGPFTLTQTEELRNYTQRFPLAHNRLIKREASKNKVDAGWATAIARAESAWMADARSHANARGLMQLLPEVAQRVAKREKLRYSGPNDLYRPTRNIPLGVAHLADESARFGGNLILASAAYNAGPTPVKRWQTQRPNMEWDLWVETIPYRETREYIARVFAFAVIYDWRMQGKSTALLDRMLGKQTVEARQVTCSLNK